MVTPLFNQVANQAWEAGTKSVYYVSNSRKIRRSTLRGKKLLKGKEYIWESFMTIGPLISPADHANKLICSETEFLPVVGV